MRGCAIVRGVLAYPSLAGTAFATQLATTESTLERRHSAEAPPIICGASSVEAKATRSPHTR